jgi:hypothetical protein
MKKILTVKTRWEYYASNIIGMIALIGLLIWLICLSIGNDGLKFQSGFFWLALLIIIMIPFGIISFLSSMKSVEVTQKDLVVTYLFKSHKNQISFSDIVEFKSRVNDQETIVRPRSIHDSFTLVLADGRMFEFSRSQFDQYHKLKSLCYKSVLKK